MEETAKCRTHDKTVYANKLCMHTYRFFFFLWKLVLYPTLYVQIFNNSGQCKAPHQCRCIEISLVINDSSNGIVLWRYHYIHHAELCMSVSSFTITISIDPKLAINLVCIMIRICSVMTVKMLSLFSFFFFPQNANLKSARVHVRW